MDYLKLIHKIQPILLLIITVGLLFSCKEKSTLKSFSISGKTMGTTYHISSIEKEAPKHSIDSLLFQINLALSIYIDSSIISKFNQSDTGIWLTPSTLESYFSDNYAIANHVYEWSEGLFDPTVMPLVNAWGFGYDKSSLNKLPDTSKILEILNYVGWRNISIMEFEDKTFFGKSHAETQLDYSAVAKGYGVDIISDFLVSKGIENHMVEIGGEVKCMGKPNSNRFWTIGINRPLENAKLNELEAVISLNNKAMATSGNYRNFQEVGGIKISHSIHPKTGFPERNRLLSATVIGLSCAEVDAVATACMIAGLENGKTLIKKINHLDAFFIYGSKEGGYGTWKTQGFPQIN